MGISDVNANMDLSPLVGLDLAPTLSHMAGCCYSIDCRLPMRNIISVNMRMSLYMCSTR